jgi:hypothetical protein
LNPIDDKLLTILQRLKLADDKLLQLCFNFASICIQIQLAALQGGAGGL